ncbi:MAG: urease accessory protein UreD [Ideonella sp.]|nr:urease accessory protein UreD [Ideonella sp.]
MAWHGTLDLDYRVSLSGGSPRCIVADRHDGPLRVLAALYPEGPAVCQSVIVHPPGGVAGGDTLTMNLTLAEGSHAMITTPGATRFYRSAGEPALQSVQARVAGGARLEWLPLETLVYSAALAESRSVFALAPGAEMIGRELVALGLPASGLAFERGHFSQHLELPGVWLERGRIDASDRRLLDSPLGLAGRRVLATQWFACGQALEPARRSALLDAARAASPDDHLGVVHGSTSPHEQVVVLRALADRVEPATELLNRVWARWRELAWGLQADAPRVWRT